MARYSLELGKFNINVNAVPGRSAEMTKEAAERVGMTMDDMKRFAEHPAQALVASTTSPTSSPSPPPTGRLHQR